MISYLDEHNVRRVHFIGVSGVSMSVLALYTEKCGYVVSGSDTRLDVTRFADSKIFLQNNHIPLLIKNADLVVYNSAIDNENMEMKYANNNGITVIGRAEYLSNIARDFNTKIGVAGCHGKTTTSCMVEEVFSIANMNLFAHIGGVDVNRKELNFTGRDYLISEVCEYKRNIAMFNPDVAVVLNIAPDHMDCYKDFNDLVNEYFSYLKRSKLAVINFDDNILNCYNGNKVTFGFNDGADYQVKDLTCKDGKYSFSIKNNGTVLAKVTLNVFGKHNVYNALATFVVAKECGVDTDIILKALNGFNGVKRRFESIGKRMNVIADYAHHPDEITASIQTFKDICKGKLFVVFQPHTYSRTKLLFDEFLNCFSKVDKLYIYKTYSARETEDKGINAKCLSDALSNSKYYNNANEMFDCVISQMKERDTLLVLGAGDIYDIVVRYVKENGL